MENWTTATLTCKTAIVFKRVKLFNRKIAGVKFVRPTRIFYDWKHKFNN